MMVGGRRACAASVTVVSVLGVVSYTVWSGTSHSKNVHDRQVRIGVDEAAPYQSWQPGAGPVGFSVDVLTEAARNTHIQLLWQFHPEGPKQAFATHSVDVWPLWATLAVAQAGVYATEPWLNNEYSIVWRGRGTGDHVGQPDWTGRTIALANLPFAKQIAARRLPPFHGDFTATRTIALQHLCRGEADGLFLEVRLLEAMLFHRPAGCDGIDLRVQVLDNTSVSMSTASSPEYRPEADELRCEIDKMFQDGRFAKFIDRWFVFSNIEARSLATIQSQRRKNLYALIALAVVLALCVLAVTMYWRARRARREAERANRAKSEFLANVSHDVRTPMNGVLALADLLLTTPLAADQRDYATTIRESASLQLAILNDLLDTAKIEAGKLTLEKVAFSPAELLEQVRLAFLVTACDKGISLKISGTEVPITTLGDPLRIRQIITNLVSNAIKFTHRGGVVIDAQAVPDNGGMRLTFAVSDTGIGIEPEHLDVIFEKFAQADRSTTRRFGGTGLGLSISRALVEIMGGRLEVESSPGVGSRFWFSLVLPVAEPLADKSGQPRSAQRVQLCSEWPVLVADDNRVNQKVAVALLKSLGLTAELANNGLEAIEKCLNTNYAVVLMDCQMPEMDGYQATAKIRQAASRHIPIIALTAGATAEERQLALNAGMDAFISKPVRREELARVVGQFTKTGKTPDSLSASKDSPSEVR